MTSARRGAFLDSRLHQWLAGLFGLWWLVLAIAPSYREDWLLENLLVFIGLPVYVYLARRVRFSAWSSIAVFAFLAFHAYGAHYTYSEAPFGFWMRDVAGTVRNPYDRLVHFMFGLLLAWPMFDVVAHKVCNSGWWVYLTTVVWIAALSTIYELLEWFAMLIFDPDLGIAFMGTQGDVFDAHKDSALAVTGAVVAMVSRYALAHRRLAAHGIG